MPDIQQAAVLRIWVLRSDTLSRIFHHPLTYHHNPEDMNLQQEDCTVKRAF